MAYFWLFPGGSGSRRARESSGSYSGYINGQSFGGSYNTPDNGPTIYESYGHNPAGFEGFGFGAGPQFSNPAESHNVFPDFPRLVNMCDIDTPMMCDVRCTI